MTGFHLPGTCPVPPPKPVDRPSASVHRPSWGQESAPFRALVEHAVEGFALVDATGIIQYVSPSVRRVLGFAPEELVGQDGLELIAPEHRDSATEQFRHVATAPGASHVAEYPYPRRGGPPVWLESTLTNLLEAPGVGAIVATFREVGERRRAAAEREGLVRELAAERARLETVLQQMPAGVIIAEAPSGRTVFANRQVDEILGYPPVGLDRIDDYAAYPVLHSDGRRYAFEEYPLARAIATGETVRDEEVGYLRGDGSRGTLSVSAAPILAPDGAIVAGVVTFSDITDRRRAEDKLRRSEQRYQAFVELSGEGIWRFELGEPIPVAAPASEQVERWFAHGRLAECNDAMARMYGRASADELKGIRLTDLLPASDPQNAAYLRAFVAAAYRLDAVESRELDPRGRERYVQKSLVGVVENGFLVRGWGTQVDVTERRRAEEDLRAGEERTRSLIGAIPAFAWETDAAGGVVYINQRWVDYTGLSVRETVAGGWHDATHPDDRPSTAERWDQARRDAEPYEVEHRFRRKDGAFRWHLSRGVPIRDAKGQVTAWFCTGFDIEDRKQHEAERADLLAREQQARAAAEDAVRLRDEFLSSASHDLKTPLTGIQARAQLLRRQFAPGKTPDLGKLEKGVATIQATAAKMASLIGELQDVSLLAIGRPLDLRLASVDLVAMAREESAQLRDQARHHRLRVEAVVPSLVVIGDPSRLSRVVTNLLGNAVKYSPEGGEVTVRLEYDVTANRTWAVLSVRDQGVGIPAADLDRIFDRFHRGANVTGRIGGQGIGLAGARQVVEQHGGTIEVESREGEGSTFAVRLPLPPTQ